MLNDDKPKFEWRIGIVVTTRVIGLFRKFLPHPDPLPLGEGILYASEIKGRFLRSALTRFLIFHFSFFIFHSAFAEIPQNVSVQGIPDTPIFDAKGISAFFSASKAQPVTGGKGQLLLHDFKIKKFGKTTNEVEFVVNAAECFGDGLMEGKDKRVWSSQKLQLHDGLTNYFIEGSPSSANVTLTISNRVHTFLQREAGTNGQIPRPLEIFSDRFFFVSETQKENPKRQATYTRNVRVDDREQLLTCEKLVIEPEGTNKVRHIEATENVVLLDKNNGGRATGERATYANENGAEILRLTGKPVWSDGTNEGRAETFIFDRKTRMIFANENARLKLPRSAVSSGAVFKPTKNPGSNDFVEIASDHFAIRTSTNRASSLVARKNVVITSPVDQTRAVSDEAYFDESSGKMELKGNASWQNDTFTAVGDVLEFDRTNQIFKASKNARLKLISQNLKPSASGTNAPPVKKDSSPTNQFVEIFCDSYELRTNVARFWGDVRATFMQGSTPGKLTSHYLEVGLSSNEVESLTARGSVDFEQIFTTTTNNTRRTMSSEQLTLLRSVATGLTKSIVVETNVLMLETEYIKGEEKKRGLKAQNIVMQFSAITNRLESMVATNDVQIEQEGNFVFGGKAVYRSNSLGETIEVTEDPVAFIQRNERRIRMAGERLVLDRATGIVTGSVREARETTEVPKPLSKDVKSSSP